MRNGERYALYVIDWKPEICQDLTRAIEGWIVYCRGGVIQLDLLTTWVSSSLSATPTVTYLTAASAVDWWWAKNWAHASRIAGAICRVPWAIWLLPSAQLNYVLFDRCWIAGTLGAQKNVTRRPRTTVPCDKTMKLWNRYNFLVNAFYYLSAVTDWLRLDPLTGGVHL